MSDAPLGRFCWYELMTTDPDATHDFYGQVASWGMAPFHQAEVDSYVMWMNGETPIGGVMQLPDVNEAVDKVKELGGTVISGPMEVPGGDWIAQCVDPQGATFAVNSTAQG